MHTVCGRTAMHTVCGRTAMHTVCGSFATRGHAMKAHTQASAPPLPGPPADGPRAPSALAVQPEHPRASAGLARRRLSAQSNAGVSTCDAHTADGCRSVCRVSRGFLCYACMGIMHEWGTCVSGAGAAGRTCAQTRRGMPSTRPRSRAILKPL